MTIPNEIVVVMERLNQELKGIERDATEGLNLLRPLLYQFPENARLIQLFATLNNGILFRDTCRRRIQITIDSISLPNVPAEAIQEAGEDLAELLGRVLEVKILVNSVLNIVENLR